MKNHDPDVATALLEPGVQDRRRRCVPVVALCMSVCVGALLTPARASACGPIPIAAYALSPAAGAVDVPLNAALIASSTYRIARFTLNDVSTGRAVPISVSCETEAGPQLCYARPGLLAARTSYVWTVVPEPQPGEEPKPTTEPGPPQFRFTTGERTDQTAPLTNLTPEPGPLFTVDILDHKKVQPNNCGINDNARLRIRMPRLDEPALVVGSGMGGLPQAWDQEGPPLLTPQSPSVERMFYTAPDCLALRLIDIAGNVRHLAPWCPPTSTSATPATNGGAATAPASGESPAAAGAQPAAAEAASCAAGPGRPLAPPSLGVVIIAGVGWAVARRRRRSQERHQAESEPRIQGPCPRMDRADEHARADLTRPPVLATPRS